MRYKPTRRERRKLFPKRVKHTVVAELEYVMGSKRYSLKDLSRPVADPVQGYVNELKRTSYDSLFDISLLELKGGFTYIRNPLRAPEELETVEFESFPDEYLEFVKETVASGKVVEPCWFEDYLQELLAPTPRASAVAHVLSSLHPTLLFTRDPNGWTIKCNGGSILALDATLKPILDYINGFIFLCKYKALYSKQAFSFEWLSERLLPPVLYFISDYPASRLPWVMAPSVEAARYKTQISKCQIKFVLAHELGHILLDHIAESTLTSSLSTMTGEKLPRGVVILNRYEIQELEADQFALNLCKSSLVNNVLLGKKVYLAEIPQLRMAVELLFLILGLIEDVAAVLLLPGRSTQVRTSSHPPAADRLEAIRSFHSMDLMDDRKSLSFAKSVFAQWLSLLQQEGLDLEGALDWLDQRNKLHRADYQGFR